MIPKLTSVRRDGDEALTIKWSDGLPKTLTLRELRDSCPCAGCRGETILFRSYVPEPQPELPDRYDLKGIEQVGTYALKMIWGDGHDTGIFSFEYLRKLSEMS